MQYTCVTIQPCIFLLSCSFSSSPPVGAVFLKSIKETTSTAATTTSTAATTTTAAAIATATATTTAAAATAATAAATAPFCFCLTPSYTLCVQARKALALSWAPKYYTWHGYRSDPTVR